MTELLDAIADSLAHTETAKEPVIGVPTVVIDGSTVATIVVTVLSSWGGCPPGRVVLLGRLRGGSLGRHLVGTVRAVVVVVEVGLAGSTMGIVSMAGDVGRGLAFVGFGNVDGCGRLATWSEQVGGQWVG